MKKDLEKQNDLAVEDGLVVSLSYVLRLDDGEQIDSAASDDPLVYLHGAQNIIPGLEEALLGLKVGDVRDVAVSPNEAYGEMNPDAFELVPYEAFPSDLELEEGMGVRMVESGTGRQVEAYISELRDDGALLDLNHPLAGETLYFNVEVVGLRRATSDEIAHGHAHSDHTH
ncbi:peptidylprolyl isomerase [Promineifilum sp.]|uniref:FKBP-type peptidyl-prolyl cis-trans isomerase n=1 Tax=Promineifilum sp. TaxID=2664178 RepID=UPI0035B3D8D8